MEPNERKYVKDYGHIMSTTMTQSAQTTIPPITIKYLDWAVAR